MTITTLMKVSPHHACRSSHLIDVLEHATALCSPLGECHTQAVMGRDPSDLDEAYRGLLFADLRGYSADVERYGDRAASALLDGYRALVRQQVADHAGAEIKTEGDSFYVVFPSAQRAVLCAIGIVSTAASHNATAGGIPIRVGIGVHAGEVVKGSEGYVGSAVNVAARVCAAAQAGEVLVTRTVRDLTRTGLMLDYVPRGSHRLKGITEPIDLFAVHGVGDAPMRSISRRILTMSPKRLRAYGITLAVGVLAFAIAILFGNQLLGRGGAAESPLSAVESHGQSAAASAAASNATAFPNEAEARLLARIDPTLIPSCGRAELADSPRTSLGSSNSTAGMPVAAGVRCRPAGDVDPDVVEYWASLETPYRDADTVFFSWAGTRKLPPGDCATNDRAYGKWENGLFSGNVLCAVTTRQATMMWTYSGQRIIAIAIREDSDGRLLYAWWRDHARTLQPGVSN
jgi:class 3 adenylate cyclase